MNDPVGLNRRDALAGGLALAAAGVGQAHAQAKPASIPIIDTHIHIYDSSRPQGVVYPDATSKSLPPVHTPDAYAAMVKTLGVVGAIAVEASPWIEDNLWALERIDANPIMVGYIGNLQPEKPEFAEFLDRYHKNPRFLGIRYATLWGYSLPEQLSNPVFIDGIRKLSAAGLVLETNASVKLLEASLRLTDAIPDLRIVIDHIAGATPPPADKAAFDAALEALRSRKTVYGKLSAAIGGRNPSPGLAAHKDSLDYLADVFGEDRVLYGSDYPNSMRANIRFETTFGLARAWAATRSPAAQEKFFWRNSAAAYRWVKRAPNQPTA